jgi:hypothetical protein
MYYVTRLVTSWLQCAQTKTSINAISISIGLPAIIPVTHLNHASMLLDGLPWDFNIFIVANKKKISTVFATPRIIWVVETAIWTLQVTIPK